MLPLKKPRKIVTVYDEGTPYQQYVTTYTETLIAVWFRKFLKIAGKIPFIQMHHVPYHERKPGYGYQFTRNLGLLVENDRIAIMGPKYARRMILNWYRAQQNNTFIFQKRDRKEWGL